MRQSSAINHQTLEISARSPPQFKPFEYNDFIQPGYIDLGFHWGLDTPHGLPKFEGGAVIKTEREVFEDFSLFGFPNDSPNAAFSTFQDFEVPSYPSSTASRESESEPSLLKSTFVDSSAYGDSPKTKFDVGDLLVPSNPSNLDSDLFDLAVPEATEFSQHQQRDHGAMNDYQARVSPSLQTYACVSETGRHLLREKQELEERSRALEAQLCALRSLPQQDSSSSSSSQKAHCFDFDSRRSPVFPSFPAVPLMVTKPEPPWQDRGPPPPAPPHGGYQGSSGSGTHISVMRSHADLSATMPPELALDGGLQGKPAKRPRVMSRQTQFEDSSDDDGGDEIEWSLGMGPQFRQQQQHFHAHHQLGGSILDSSYTIARYSPEERARALQRYREKRAQRTYSKKIRYACRKKLADTRPRNRGRFAKAPF